MPTATTRALFIDCDDCLYQNEWRTEARITARMAEYLETNLGIDREKANSLYKQYGTTLRGLLQEELINRDGADAFLVDAHTIDYCDITPDPQLASVLSKLALPTWVFTAGTREHAIRCMDHLALSGHLALEGIVDVRTCQFESKHSEVAFACALDAARRRWDSMLQTSYAYSSSTLKPEECLLCDDSPKNIQRAKALGWRTVLVGKTEKGTGAPRAPCEAADFVVSSLHELPAVLPELFSGESAGSQGGSRGSRKPRPAASVVTRRLWKAATFALAFARSCCWGAHKEKKESTRNPVVV